ncbi:MAG TPA: non-homologous end-joining DNA ligase [Roseiarcus sp.]|nr:non-homologous end-joining DNA ligase [Roseiarcus sp.]
MASPPEWIEPCLPTLVDRPPSGDNWRHEIKWDGYRLCVVVDAGKATVRTRRGHDWTHRFKSIGAAAAALPCRNAVLDGEAVVLDEQGRASFSSLQARLDGESRAEVVLYAFDLLWLDGRDLRSLPLGARRTALEDLIGKPASGAILLSEEFDGAGDAFLNVARKHGLEGMVSKRLDRPYRSGRSSDWLKVKIVQSDDFLIIGYQPDGRGGIANLKLAREEAGALRYAGAVGTGFSVAVMRDLLKQLKPLAQKTSPVAGLKVKGAVWTRPELRAEVAYRGFTATGELRAASFKGLREPE